MNPSFQGSLPPGYPGAAGVANLSSTVGAMPGVMSPLAYTHGVYSPVSPTYSVPGSLSAYQQKSQDGKRWEYYGANGQVAGAPPGSGLLYEGTASPLMRPYGKSNPYGVPATHSQAHAYQTAISSAPGPAHTQSPYTHSLSQPGSTLYSPQSAYPPGLHPGILPPSSMYQAQARQLYLPNGTQPAVNPALGLSPALAARGSPMHTIPAAHQSYYMAAQPPAGGGAIYPSQAFYPTYHPGYQS